MKSQLFRKNNNFVLAAYLIFLSLIAYLVLASTEQTSFWFAGSAAFFGFQWPQYYRFMLGKFEITTLLDGVVQSEDTHPRYGINQSASTVLNYAESRGLPSKWYENGFVPVLVNTGRELVLFDTGNGKSRNSGQLGNLRPLLEQAGYRPENIDIVAITHGHPDHILGLVDDGQTAFPNARYIFGQVEFDFWNKGEGIPSFRTENRELYVRIVTPLADRATFVKNGDQIVSGIHAVEAFGHSAGHLAFRLESEGRQIMVIGDTTNHYILSLQQPDWHFNRDDNKELAAKTRRRILDLVSADNIPVIGHHLPFPSVGYVEKTAEGYRWSPVSYQFNR